MVKKPPQIYLRLVAQNHLIRILLPLILGGIICWLSLTSSPPQISGFWGWDKFLHAFAYGFLSLLSAQSLYIYIHNYWLAGICAALTSTLFGAFLEIVQSAMQAGRYAEWGDLAADASGAAVGSVLFCLVVVVVSRYRKLDIDG